MPLVHFDRQTVLDFFDISVEDAAETIKHIGYKDPIDVTDDFSGDDVKAIAMTYAHRKHPGASDSDKVSFGSQVAYLVCGMYTGVAHYFKEQKAEQVFEAFKKAYGVDPGDEGPEIKGNLNAQDFTRAGILLLAGLILSPDDQANSASVLRELDAHSSLFDPAKLESIKKTVSGLDNLKL
jgi:hypothetical protein